MPGNLPRPDYVLITAARNEEIYLPATLKSVGQQTLLPVRWVVCVNDSTDKTLEIVRQYALTVPFVLPLNISLGGGRSFGNKALAVKKAFAEIEHLPFEFVGVLDADQCFGPEFFSLLLQKFFVSPRLGIATGMHLEVFPDGSSQVLRQPADIAVCGMQMFRRNCFCDIGGLRPLKWGGVDTLAGIMARERGWRTRTFDDVKYEHLRQMGTGAASTLLVTRFRYGIRDQKLGMEPVYALLKFLKRLAERPYVIGSMAWLVGFACALCLPNDENVQTSSRILLRREQWNRLGSILCRGLGIVGAIM